MTGGFWTPGCALDRWPWLGRSIWGAACQSRRPDPHPQINLTNNIEMLIAVSMALLRRKKGPNIEAFKSKLHGKYEFRTQIQSRIFCAVTACSNILNFAAPTKLAIATLYCL